MSKLLVSAILFVTSLLLSLDIRAVAASDPEPELCDAVATAGGIMVYYCEDIDLYINSLGFMAFEP